MPEYVLDTFWGAGFDALSPLMHHKGKLHRWDMVAASQHDVCVDLDYGLLNRLGIRWSREDVRWYLAEARPGEYDFSHLEPLLAAARRNNVQIVWSLLHYGFPDFLKIYDSTFPARMAAYAQAFARWLAMHHIQAPIIAPICEPSFFAWAVDGLKGWYPFGEPRPYEFKHCLLQGYCSSAKAIKQVLAAAKILAIDPFYYIFDICDDWSSHQHALMDFVAGLEFFQSVREWTDIIGINYYIEGQRQLVYNEESKIYDKPMLGPDDPRRLSLREVLLMFHAFFPEKSLLVTETSIHHPGRASWLQAITLSAIAAMREGVPLEGICWYPIIDVPNTSKVDPQTADLSAAPLAPAGLISVQRTEQGLERSFNPDLAALLKEQEKLLQAARQQPK